MLTPKGRNRVRRSNEKRANETNLDKFGQKINQEKVYKSAGEATRERNFRELEILYFGELEEKKRIEREYIA